MFVNILNTSNYHYGIFMGKRTLPVLADLNFRVYKSVPAVPNGTAGIFLRSNRKG